jgi:hypothetical protein
MKTLDEKREFYDNCASILNIDHEFHDPVPRRTRWNTRFLGNGRYSGFGLVQCFGSSVRVVSKHGTKMFNTYEETYDYLKILVDKCEESV